MKKIIIVLIIGIISSALYSQNNIDITYIANDGFLITSDSEKILIDGIFTKGNINFSYPSDEVLLKERNAENPFDSIDFILNTHYHADHLNAGYVVEHMISDTSSIFIGPQQSFDLIKVVDNFDTVKNRVLSISPESGTKIDTTFHGKAFKILNLSHHNDNANQFQVNGYVFQMDNIRIFHPGDGGIDNMAELEALKLDEDSIDIAFIPFWIVGDDLETIGRQVINYLHPKIIIIMHVWVSEVEFYKNRITELDNLPPIYYPNKSLDQISVEKYCDSLIVKDKLVTNFEDLKAEQFKLFPNPANDILHFEPLFNSPAEATIELHSFQGDLLTKRTINFSYQSTINLSGLAKGIYILSVHTRSQIFSNKIIIF